MPKPGPNRDHDPPAKRHLNENGVDTRPHEKVKPRPGDHPQRKWKPEHRAAGYHLQDWDHADLHADHEICGDYICSDGSTLTIRFLEAGHTGAPELELDWEPGPTVTVLDATVAEDYIAMLSATRLTTQ